MRIQTIAVLVLLLLVSSICLAQNPHIDTVSPPSGIPGTQVTVTGSGFAATQGTGSILLGSGNGSVVSWSDTQIVAIIATGAVSGSVQVTQFGAYSNGIPFRMSAPVLSSVSPSNGVPGTQVTLSGSGFGATQGTGNVLLGNATATIVSWSDTQVVATVASNAVVGIAQVTQNNVSSNQLPFRINPPILTSVSPTSGVPGMQITLTGSGFHATQGTGSVLLGNINASVASWSDTQIVATIAAGSVSEEAWVVQNNVTSNILPFRMNRPVLSSVSPASGTAGTQITLTGSGFGATQGNGSVKLGNVPAATIVSWSDTQVVATVASNAVAGYAWIVQYGEGSDQLRFNATGTPPNITSVTPSSGTPGVTQVTINGSGFGATQGNGRVELGTTWATSYSSWSDTQIVALLPAPSAPGSAQVQQSNGLSNAVPFSIIPSVITSVSPTIGTPGVTQVTINGSGFGATQGSGRVQLGTAWATSYSSWSDTQIVALLPAPTAQGFATVQQYGTSSNSLPFNITPPVITSVSPPTGTPLVTQVTITGSGFGATQGTGNGSGAVFIGSANSPITSWSDTQIVATIPVPANNGNCCVQVRQYGVSSNSIPFFPAPPVLSSVTPISGTAGVTQVTLSGSGFGATQGTGQVELGSAFATSIASWGDTQIVATVPSGSTPGVAMVRQYGVNGNTLPFNIGSLSVTSISPANGLPGTQVTITGTGFGSSQGNGKVWIGSKLGTVVSWSTTQIVATVASGSQTGHVAVLQSSFWSNLVGFTIDAPVISSISPTSGAVGTSVTITGTGFDSSQGTSTVKFNGISATPTGWSATSIVVPVPSGATSGNVVVTAPGGPSNGMSFTVLQPPVISQLSPNSGPIGTSVVVTGSNFGNTQGSSQLLIAGIPFSVTSWNDSTITANIPSGVTTGQLPVTVVTSSGSSNGLNFQTVPSPLISGISTNIGTAGTSVTITGSNFGASQNTLNGAVTIGGATAGVTSWSATSITAQVPSEAEPGLGSLNVTLSAVPSNSFAFTVLPSLSSAGSGSGGSGTIVALSGGNFGSSQGSGAVQFGSTTAVVSSWGPVTILAQVPDLPVGATSVTVSTGGSTTNAISFTVNPSVSNLTPASGNVGTTVTIDGGSFGSSGTVTFNGVQAAITSWTNTEIVTQVPSGATSGNVVVASSGIAAPGVPFLIVSMRLSGDPISSLTITPSTFSMFAGESRELTAVDDLGNPVTDVTWSTSDSTIVSFTDGTSTLTANNAGEVTITATSQSQTAQATGTVYLAEALPPGTSIWSVSAPALQLGAPVKFMATPTGTNKSDMFFITHDYNDTSAAVRGLTVDGGQLWSTTIPKPGPNSSLSGWMPDRFGGVIFTSYYLPSNISRIDGDTGKLSWTYASSTLLSNPQAIGQDGTVYTIATITTGSSAPAYSKNYILALDGHTGHPKFTVDIPQSYGKSIASSGYVSFDGPQGAQTGPFTVMPDGSVYLEAASYDDRTTGNSRTFSQRLDLIKINPDGTSSKQNLGAWTASGNVDATPDGGTPGEVIPDGHGQYLATWVYSPASGSSVVLKGNHAGTEYTIPLTNFAGRDVHFVLGENDVAFAEGFSGLRFMAFNINNGTPVWTDSNASGGALIAATAGGGLMTQQNGQLVQYDSTGNKSNGTLVSDPIHVAGDAFLNGGYGAGPAAGLSLTSSGTPIELAKNGPWARPQADASSDPKVRVKLHVYQIDDSTNGTYAPNQISNLIQSAADYWWKKAVIELDWDSSITTLVGCDHNLHPFGCSEQQDLTEIHNLSQYAEIVDNHKMDTSQGVGLFFTSQLFYKATDSPGDTRGITPFNFRNSGKYEPRIMFQHFAPWQVVAHELGHTFQLTHYTTTDALTELNPADYFFGFDYIIAGILQAKNNLMCGDNPSGTTVLCARGTPNTDLTPQQILQAVKGAAERSQQ